MQANPFNVTQEQAREALNQYREHRNSYDARDWEIERIYRNIARGKTVISAFEAIRKAGLDEMGRPRLALMRADQEHCRCELYSSDEVILTNVRNSRAGEWHFRIPWPNRPRTNTWSATSQLPRIPPQHRPSQGTLTQYHLLWEAEWTDQPPSDPMLLKRIGKDAWIVLAAWDLTEVELSVLRTHQRQ